jgi:hypothetical protein
MSLAAAVGNRKATSAGLGGRLRVTFAFCGSVGLSSGKLVVTS